ncbi:TPA: DGQHR domain-containing protein, partial [Listeria monocytogenes]|nr:DGQHR domain-containing protein [Listeria monocytogenes]
IPYSLKEEYELDGWSVDRELKSLLKMKRPKSPQLLFKNKVWLTFCNLGFHKMNKDENFHMPYTPDHSVTQRFDVFAADDETGIFIICESTEEHNKLSDFNERLTSIGEIRGKLIAELKKSFPTKKIKPKFILATKNFNLSTSDKDLLSKYCIYHFDENALQYYEELSQHLGFAARYQLLGNLFEGEKIQELDNITTAIEGQMGGHTYYSFSIEPEKLLKLSYVLHRNNVNKDSMPAYQRIIKKSRLNQVKDFVNKGGFFPNSIIINIDTKSKGLTFDRASLQDQNSISRIGLLHLPKKYKSLYIIDGQHRLYGYSDSKFSKTNSIPVVAFLDLKKADQVRLFMEINENQKAVSKNLQNTLNSDLLWDSSVYNERRKAVNLKIAQQLGEDRNSRLFDRIIIGENNKTDTCCITIDTIKNGIDKSNFLSTFSKKNELIEKGTFDKDDNESTYQILYPFLLMYLNYIAEQSSNEWNKGDNDNGILSINVGIYSLIKISNDIINYLISKNIRIHDIPLDDLLTEMKLYLEPIVLFLNNLDYNEKKELRTSYGGGGKTKYWRKLQCVINDKYPDFSPPGLQEYIENDKKIYNQESFNMIRDIESFFKVDFENKLKDFYGERWFIEGVPKSVYDTASKLAIEKTYTSKDGEVQAWDCLNLIHYREIAIHGSNWKNLFEKSYTKPGEEKIKGGKKDKTKWIHKLSNIRNKNFHEYSVTKEDHDFLVTLEQWLLKENL